jgi:hypothetical protein
MRSRQKFPYWDWEDYRAGLYALTWGGTAADARRLLSAPTRLHAAMTQAVEQWPNAAAHHLTDDGLNQQAWLGWAACGIAAAVPAHETRAAWWQLSESERAAANAVAARVIRRYQRGATLFDA